MGRRHKGELPRYRLHKQSGQAIVSLPLGGGKYRDILLGKHGSQESQREYTRVINEGIASGMLASSKSSGGLYDLTVAEVCNRFKHSAQSYYRLADGSPSREPEHVDLDSGTATSGRTRHRQLSLMAKRVDIEPIAAEVVGLIVGGVSDERLHWLDDGRVRVELGRIFPEQSGFKQTIQGRGRKLREALIEALAPRGWTHLGRNTFRQTCPMHEVRKLSL
jgi:hypothetical protein